MSPRRPLLAAFVAALCLFSSSLALALAGTPVAPSGKIATESRDARDFTGVALAIPGTAVIRQGAPASVAIEADDNLLPEIETVVERGVLKIRFKRPLKLGGRATIRLLVTGPAIESLAVAGSGDILAESIKARALDISVAGSGDVKIARLEAGSLKASVAGSGNIKAGGKVEDFSASIAGSGDIGTGPLECRRAKVSIAGSGNVAVRARESLDVSTTGSGDVSYYGDPAITKRVIGSGALKRLGSAP